MAAENERAVVSRCGALIQTLGGDYTAEELTTTLSLADYVPLSASEREDLLRLQTAARETADSRDGR